MKFKKVFLRLPKPWQWPWKLLVKLTYPVPPGFMADKYRRAANLAHKQRISDNGSFYITSYRQNFGREKCGEILYL